MQQTNETEDTMDAEQLERVEPQAPPWSDLAAADRARLREIAHELRGGTASGEQLVELARGILEETTGYVSRRRVLAKDRAALDGRGHESGAAGALLLAQRAVDAALDRVEEIEKTEGAERSRVAKDARLSDAGKREGIAEIAERFATELRRQDLLAPARTALDARERSLLLRLAPQSGAAKSESEIAALTRAVGVNSLLSVRAPKNASEFADVVIECARIGAPSAAGLLDLAADGGIADVLELRRISSVLTNATNARRLNELVGDPERLDTAVEVLLVRAARARLTALERFLLDSPGEAAMARQLGSIVERVVA